MFVADVVEYVHQKCTECAGGVLSVKECLPMSIAQILQPPENKFLFKGHLLLT